MNVRIFATMFATAALLCSGLAAGLDAADNWPTWRGPTPNGIAVKGDPPTQWSETENIKWTAPVPGQSSSTPIIWGDKLFIQTAVPTGDEPAAEEAPQQGRRRGPPSTPAPGSPLKFNVVCMDRNTGEILWEKTAREAVPHEGHHPTGSFAAYSPVTDGEKLWASFGSRGLHCYDLDGNHLWSEDLLQMQTRNRFGEASSPALAGDVVVVVQDHEGQSKIFGFNKDTGEKLWEKDRQEITSWATPLAIEHDGRYEVITTATRRITSYDANTGETIWECGGMTLNAIPTPVHGFGMVFCTSGFRGSALKAIELGNTGDLTDTAAVKWEVDQDTPYVASPMLYGDKLYLTADLNPVISCYNAETGEPHYVGQRIDGLSRVYASPIGAGGHVYLADREGNVVVLKHGDEFEVVAQNKLDDVFDASPVVVGDAIYLKGAKNIYCIAAD
jgi:outer membrane protein assembly factor BamB